ncbi:C10 family peptidase [Candidatus Eisenbacteria bacterium]|uniref:C10 family peptidase n=1 Tax=Eiseniibacteriota bacterium TaxID=2212470 RepID=A0ABV6YNF0_UNCEI
MRKTRMVLLAMWAAVLLSTSPVMAERVTPAEAGRVATNWISTILHSRGSWGDHEGAQVREIEELWQGDRLLGYCCHIEPGGYIIVPIHKAMAPVKAFLPEGRIDLRAEAGVAGLIRDGLGYMVDFIETNYGPTGSVSAEDLKLVLEVDYAEAWTRLEVEPGSFGQELESRGRDMSPLSVMGDILTTSAWHQGEPYHNFCPTPPGGDDCTEPHCTVGCVGLAGAQIMHYWNWPPRGESVPYDNLYDWAHMPDMVTIFSPLDEISAVAELCFEVARACTTNFCNGTDPASCSSGASIGPMMDAYHLYFRYHPGIFIIDRTDFDSDTWWNWVRGQIDGGWPAQYTMTNHSMVLDGYWEESGSRFYHLNMGWYPGDNTWYAMNAIPGNDPSQESEHMVGNIRPLALMSYPVSGTYSKPAFPYRYFDDGLISTGAVFESGQYLQFHREAFFVCAHPGPIVFNGSPAAGSTHIYNNGDPTRGIRIDNGAITFNYGGQMRLHWNN